MSIRSYDRKARCAIDAVDSEAVSSALSSLPAEQVRKVIVDIYDALADETRLRILLALAESELCVCDLEAVCGISQSGVSHQLRLLRDRDLVAYRRDGKRAVYRLADEHVRALLAFGLEHAEERGK